MIKLLIRKNRQIINSSIIKITPLKKNLLIPNFEKISNLPQKNFFSKIEEKIIKEENKKNEEINFIAKKKRKAKKKRMKRRFGRGIAINDNPNKIHMPGVKEKKTPLPNFDDK